jgi:phosphoglycerol transferase MdoB-like AlkP superfamily enzyme
MTAMKRSTLFQAVLLISAMMTIYLMAQAFEVLVTDGQRSLGASLLFYNWVILEFLLCLMLARIIASVQSLKMRLIGYAVLSFVALVYLIQMTSLWVGGEFLTRLALENIVHSDFILGQWAPYILPIVIAGMSGVWVSIDRFTVRAPWTRGSGYMLASMMMLCLLLLQSENWAPKAIKKERDEILERFGLAHAAPAKSFVYILQKPSGNDGKLNQEDVDVLARRQISVSPAVKYPLVKRSAYSSLNPVREFGLELPRRPNVVLLFAEGISARSIEVYSDRHKGLTPNLVTFSERAIVFDNYWSHTAASYRGMKGQLCSLYPFHDGTDASKGRFSKYFCLPDVFREAGYRSIFVNAHNYDSSYLDEMMPMLGFDETLSAENLLESHLPGMQAAGQGSLSDHQFFKVIALEIEKQSKQLDKKPFFIAAYNLGTHAFFDVTSGEVKWREGKNNSLNTIHNFDHAFGEFWESFTQSDAAKNTVFILTSDHAHYMEASFIRAFGDPGYSRIFFDRVPLMVYSPSLKKSIRYNAKNATSVDLAATVSHLLGLPDGPNPWVGTSIFDRGRNSSFNSGIVGYPGHVFVVGDDEPKAAVDPNHEDVDRRAIRRFFDYTNRLESLDRIWNPELRTRGRVAVEN